ncbi:hypothetical protein C8Q74DRAFT_1336563 [Fomes fomentarius]|nr:hypothetical protein C8Q74DRAFT_1336563 [Fomes fomentarius]
MMEDTANTTIHVPLDDFQRRYLPKHPDFDASSSRIQTISKEFRSVWKQVQNTSSGIAKDRALSKVWTKIDRFHGLCPGHVLHLSKKKYDDGDEIRYKVDGSYIRKEDQNQSTANVPNWAFQRLSVEIKCMDTGSDPYDDSVTGSITELHQKVRGQVTSYAKHAFDYQHRTALFFLFVNGNTFRMMRWDRSGVIISEAKDYVRDLRNTRVLLELLHSFSQMSEKDQGFDGTVEPLLPNSCGWRRMDALAHAHRSDLESTEREVSLDDPQVQEFLRLNSHSNAASMFAKDLLHVNPTASCNHAGGVPVLEHATPVFTEVRTLFRDSISTDFPRYVLKVGDRRFLVGKPIFCASGMVSRGTRGYVALDWGTQRFVFLKDAWRPCHEGLVPEGETLRKLNEKEVPGVPTYVCACDVPNQETETSKYSVTGPYYEERCADSQERQGSELRHLHHYRLVVEEVCLPSTKFESAWELTSIIYTCIQAHSAAYTLCGIIHRDVSAGNILILPKVVEDSDRYYITRVGILSDWELSKEVGITHDMQPHRTGTWQFMACRCIRDPCAIVGVPEEIESFLYVHLYHATRFLPTSIARPISCFMTDFFHGYVDTGCPPSKDASVSQGRLTYDGRRVQLHYRDVNGQIFTHPCNALIDEIFIHLKARYDMLGLLEAQTVKPTRKPPKATQEDLKALQFRASRVRAAAAALNRQPARVTQPEIAPPPAPVPHNPEVPAQVAPAVAGDARSGSNAPAVDPVPSEMRCRAEKLDTHDWVLSVFDDALYGRAALWPKQDKIEDQLAHHKLKERHSDPSVAVPSAAVTVTNAGGKRSRGSEDSGVLELLAQRKQRRRRRRRVRRRRTRRKSLQRSLRRRLRGRRLRRKSPCRSGPAATGKEEKEVLSRGRGVVDWDLVSCISYGPL